MNRRHADWTKASLDKYRDHDVLALRHSTTLVIHHVCQRMPSKPLFSTSIESRKNFEAK